MPWIMCSRVSCCGLFLLLLVSGCGRVPSLPVAGKFQEAQQIFDSAQSPRDFLRAAGLYEEIRDAGIVSGAVLYNQGNAYMRAGRRGEAIACYRQAQRYRPRDARLRANLRFALNGGETLPPPTPLAHALFWRDWLSYREKFTLTSVLVTLAVVFWMLAVTRPQASAWSRLALATMLLAVVAGGSAAYDWYRFEHLRHGVLIEDRVTARLGDGEGYEPAFNQPLPEATEFRVLQQRNLWLLIELAGGQRAWIRADAAVVY